MRRIQNSAKSTVVRLLSLGLLGIGVIGIWACSSDPEGSDNGDSAFNEFVDGEVHDLVMGEETACVLDGDGVVDCGFSNIFNADEEESLADGDWTRIGTGPWIEEDVGLWATEDGEHWVGFGKDRLIDEHFDMMPEGPFTQIASARSHSCGIDIEGRIECWGQETSVSDTLDTVPSGDGWLRLMRYTDPSDRGTGTHPPFCAVHTDGEFECWGGEPGTVQKLVDDAPSGDQWIDAVIADDTICALEEDGNIECWHAHFEPRDWFESYEEASVEDGTEVRDMAFADKTLIVVDGQGTINVWGPEQNHALTADAVDGAGFEQVEAATVSYRSSGTSGLACALDGEGAMECWGDDSLHEDYFP